MASAGPRFPFHPGVWGCEWRALLLLLVSVLATTQSSLRVLCPGDLVADDVLVLQWIIKYLVAIICEFESQNMYWQYEEREE